MHYSKREEIEYVKARFYIVIRGLTTGHCFLEADCSFSCPCLTCSIKIAQVGISEVVYSQSYSMDKEV